MSVDANSSDHDGSSIEYDTHEELFDQVRACVDALPISDFRVIKVEVTIATANDGSQRRRTITSSDDERRTGHPEADAVHDRKASQQADSVAQNAVVNALKARIAQLENEAQLAEEDRKMLRTRVTELEYYAYKAFDLTTRPRVACMSDPVLQPVIAAANARNAALEANNATLGMQVRRLMRALELTS